MEEISWAFRRLRWKLDIAFNYGGECWRTQPSKSRVIGPIGGPKGLDMFATLLSICSLKLAIIAAIIQVESGGNDFAVGDNGNAVGCLQIWPIMVDDVNRFSVHHFTYDDRFDRQKSIMMFVEYTNHYTPSWDLEKVIRRWNGGPHGDSKEATAEYFHRVLQEMNNVVE